MDYKIVKTTSNCFAWTQNRKTF